MLIRGRPSRTKLATSAASWMSTSPRESGNRPSRRLPVLRSGRSLRLAVGFDQALADRVLYQLGPVVHPQLLHDVVAVSLDRLDAEEKRVGDLPVRLALGDETQHLALAIAERLERLPLRCPLQVV